MLILGEKNWENLYRISSPGKKKKELALEEEEKRSLRSLILKEWSSYACKILLWQKNSGEKKSSNEANHDIKWPNHKKITKFGNHYSWKKKKTFKNR